MRSRWVMRPKPAQDGISKSTKQRFHSHLDTKLLSTFLTTKSDANNEIYYRFNLWAVGFDAGEGGLDDILFHAERLRSVLLPILSDMMETLVKLAGHFGVPKEIDVCSRAKALKAQVSQLVSDSLPDSGSFDDKPTPNMVEKLSSKLSALIKKLGFKLSALIVDEVEELLEDLKSSNDCLFELVPVLEHPAERSELDGTKARDNPDPEPRQDSVWISHITNAYPFIDQIFAQRLGEANSSRYLRLRERRTSVITGSKQHAMDQGPASSKSAIPADVESAIPSTQLSSGRYFRGSFPPLQCSLKPIDELPNYEVTTNY